MATATTFAERLAHACRYHREAPADYGQQAWLRRRLRDLGEDVSSTAVSNWFSGYTQARPSLRAKLAQILEVDPAWLAGSDQAAAPHPAKSGNLPTFPSGSVASSMETVDIPVPLRSGMIVRISGIPADLTEAEARKLSNVILALAAIRD